MTVRELMRVIDTIPEEDLDTVQVCFDTNREIGTKFNANCAGVLIIYDKECRNIQSKILLLAN